MAAIANSHISILRLLGFSFGVVLALSDTGYAQMVDRVALETVATARRRASATS